MFSVSLPQGSRLQECHQTVVFSLGVYSHYPTDAIHKIRHGVQGT